jgi:hypothetical protein
LSVLPATLYVGVFAFTLLVSGALLFLVQPILGKLVLPRLGGSAAVWGTCLVFFQVLLLAGYAYAHGSIRLLGTRRQAALHLALVGLPLVLWALGVLPLLSAGDWVPPEDNPACGLFVLLLAVVGLPFFALAATAPLLQRWFAGTGHPEAGDPYFLYAASNLGSMAALVVYPTLLEPFTGLAGQRAWWVGGYAALALLVLVSALLLWLAPRLAVPRPLPVRERAEPDPAPRLGADDRPLLPAGVRAVLRRLRWLALSALPAALLVGLNTYVFTDIFAIPLFWVAPLALYLLSFVIAFARQPLLARAPWGVRLMLQILHGLAIVGLFVLLTVLPTRLPAAGPPGVDGPGVPTVPSPLIPWVVGALGCLVLLVPHAWMMVIQPLVALGLLYNMLSRHAILEGYALPLHLLGLYVAARSCHGELARDRPPAGGLTEYFLWIALGGALGGLFSALLAPLLFRTAVTEYWLVLVLVCMFRPGGLVNGGADALVVLLLNAGARLKPSTKRRVRAVVGAVFDVLWPVVIGLLVLLLWWKATSPSWGPDDTDLRTWLRRGARDMAAWRRAELVYNLIVCGLPLFLCLLVVGRRVRFGLALGAALLAITLGRGWEEDPYRGTVLLRTRNYYGTIRVEEQQEPADGLAGEVPRQRFLMHGTTHHGLNYDAPARLRRLATTYYHRNGPVGEVMRRFDGFAAPRPDRFGGRPFDGREPRRNPYAADVRLPASLVALAGGLPVPGAPGTPVACGPLLLDACSEPAVGVLGLGTGTMASYVRPFQRIDFYELDPAIRDLSLPPDGRPPLFNYLADARQRGAWVNVFVGDGRTKLARQAPDGLYRVLVVDAFGSDAIPAHLLTREAFETYLRKLAPDGVLCLHISNRYVNLVPVVGDVAESLGLAWVCGRDLFDRGRDRNPDDRARFSSHWVMVARDPRLLPAPGQRVAAPPAPFGRDMEMLVWERPDYAGRGRHVWTDDYTNLGGVIRENLDGALTALTTLLLVVGGLVLLVELLSGLLVAVLGPPAAPPPVVLALAEGPPAEAGPPPAPGISGDAGTERRGPRRPVRRIQGPPGAKGDADAERPPHDDYGPGGESSR